MLNTERRILNAEGKYKPNTKVNGQWAISNWQGKTQNAERLTLKANTKTEGKTLNADRESQ